MAIPRGPRWRPSAPVPWPKTGDPALDLLRAAVEARLYPYGDLVSSPGRSTAAHQILQLQSGRERGMTDEEVAAFMSANIACGGTPIYRRDQQGLPPAGYVTFGGRSGPADVMGRRSFYWTLSAGYSPAAVVTWDGADLYQAFRRAFSIPLRHTPEPCAPTGRWEADQGVLF